MSQVLLFTPPFFRGTISDTPSGTAYHVKPGETVTANETDQAFLLDLGFSPAAPNAAGVTTVKDSGTTITNATTIDFTSGATVSDLGGGVAGVSISWRWRRVLHLRQRHLLFRHVANDHWQHRDDHAACR